jgi:hypothetical protein
VRAAWAAGGAGRAEGWRGAAQPRPDYHFALGELHADQATADESQYELAMDAYWVALSADPTHVRVRFPAASVGRWVGRWAGGWVGR